MAIIKKAVFFVLYGFLGAGALYTGICCAATLWHSHFQAYLRSDVVEYAFLGYYYMAGVYGLLAGLCLLLLGVMIRYNKKRRAKNHG